jgi:hypothetical protein
VIHSNAIQSRAPIRLNFGVASNLFMLKPAADTSTINDQLRARLSQLSTLLTVVATQRSNFSEAMTDDSISTCSMLADECQALAEAIESLDRGRSNREEHTDAATSQDAC